MRAEDRPVPDPRLVRNPEEHLAFLYAIDLIGDYGSTRDGVYWVELHNRHAIDLNLAEVEIFARGIAYAVQYLFSLNERQQYEMARYNVALRALPARW